MHVIALLLSRWVLLDSEAASVVLRRCHNTGICFRSYAGPCFKSSGPIIRISLAVKGHSARRDGMKSEFGWLAHMYAYVCVRVFVCVRVGGESYTFITHL